MGNKTDSQLKLEIEKQIDEEIDFERLTELCEHLKEAIREIFTSCGLYFRIFTRVKTKDSISNKIVRGKYGTPENPKNMQDLIGLRVVLYYYDDLRICRDVMESTFQMVDDWSKTNYDADEFKATKINGVFKFPSEYFKLYTKEMWTLPIDTTFELQFRTVFFEGWHEIEHDMRYKSILTDQQFWQGSEELSRILNCILANLELSDWSLVQLFEQLSYNHYKNGNWELMLKSKFRIKMDDTAHLDPRILAVFDSDKEIAKCFFKCPREDLIRELLKMDNPHVSYNLIVKILNKRDVHNEQLTEICNNLPVERNEHAFMRTNLARLENNILFQMDIPLLHKEVRKLESEFANSASIIYKWVRYKMNPVFEDIPVETSSYYNSLPGYELNIEYNPHNYVFTMMMKYIDEKLVGTLWHIEASICLGEDNTLRFSHNTWRNTPYGTAHRETFIKPSYINDLSSKIGIIDVIRLGNRPHFVNNAVTYDSLLQLLDNPNRKLPIVVLCQNYDVDSSDQNAYRNGYDMNTFTINGTRLTKVIGLYCHVYMLDRNFLDDWVEKQNSSLELLDGSIMIFWNQSSQKGTEIFTKNMVNNAQFDFNRFAFYDENIYEKAFRHKLVQLIKDDNVGR